VPGLLQIHDPLHGFELRLADDWLADHLNANHIFWTPLHLPAIRLPAVFAFVLPCWRRVALFVDDAPSGPDWIAHDDMHAARSDSNQLRQIVVTVLACEETPEGFSHSFRLGFIEEALPCFVPNPEWQYDIALRQFPAATLLFLRTEDALEDFRPFESRNRGANGSHESARFAIQVQGTIRKVEHGSGIDERLQQRVIGKVLRAHQAGELAGDNTADVWRLHEQHQVLNLGSKKN
jgi:hypothetical protein